MRFKMGRHSSMHRSVAQRSNGRGLRFHYMLWLHAAFKEASRLNEQVGFDIGHHVSYGSVSAPPPVRTLGIPFVWGPIGGAQQAPSSFRGYFGRTWPREIARNARVRCCPFPLRFGALVRASLVTLATNQETADLLRRAGVRDVRLFLDSGTLRVSFQTAASPNPVTRASRCCGQDGCSLERLYRWPWKRWPK